MTLSEVQEHEDCYMLWCGNDDWYLEIRLTPRGWELHERIWAVSPCEEEECYFTKTIDLNTLVRFNRR